MIAICPLDYETVGMLADDESESSRLRSVRSRQLTISVRSGCGEIESPLTVAIPTSSSPCLRDAV